MGIFYDGLCLIRLQLPNKRPVSGVGRFFDGSKSTSFRSRLFITILTKNTYPLGVKRCYIRGREKLGHGDKANCRAMLGAHTTGIGFSIADARHNPCVVIRKLLRAFRGVRQCLFFAHHQSPLPIYPHTQLFFDFKILGRFRHPYEPSDTSGCFTSIHKSSMRKKTGAFISAGCQVGRNLYLQLIQESNRSCWQI